MITVFSDKHSKCGKIIYLYLAREEMLSNHAEEIC